MGYDVTFHPISRDELKTYLFSVLASPDTTDQTALTLARGSEDIQLRIIRGIYRHFPEFTNEVVRSPTSFGSCFGFAAAALAGYLHPYWYARGFSITDLLPQMPHPTWLRSVWSLAPRELLESHPQLSTIRDGTNGRILQNYTGGGIIWAEDVPAFEAWLLQHRAYINEMYGAGFGTNGLYCAVAYARKHNLGLMEATDLIVPLSGECFTNRKNFRAAFLKNEGIENVN